MTRGAKEGVVLLSLAAALLALCGLRLHRRLWPTPPPPLACPSCMFSGAAEQQARAAAEQRAMAWARQLASEGSLMDPLFWGSGWLAERRAEGSTFAATFRPDYPLATGVVGRLELVAHSVLGRLATTFPEAFVENDAPRAVWSSPPRDAYLATRSPRVEVVARVDPARRWLAAEATVALQRHQSPTAVLDFPVVRVSPERAAASVPDELASYAGGLDVESVTADGSPLPFVIGAEQLAVRLPPGRHQVRVRYSGEPRDANAFFLGDSAYLRSWFPLAVASAPELRLTVMVPEAYQVLGLGRPEHTATAGGWTTRMWRLPAGTTEPTAVILPRVTPHREVRLPQGVTLRLHGRDEPRLVDSLEAAYGGLAQMNLPFRAELDVVLGELDASGDGAIFLRDDRALAYHPAAARWLVARLVAEQWFGHQVTDLADGATPFLPSVSGYLALLALGDVERAEILRQLADHDAAAGPLPVGAESPMRRGRADRFLPRGVRLLVALSEQIGEGPLRAALRGLMSSRRGGREQARSWQDLENAITDERAAGWLQRALGAPQLEEAQR